MTPRARARGGTTRAPERGVILINVLVVLALGATAVAVMLSLGDISIARSQRFGEAGQALALVQAGERSAITALRRDMLEAPDIDHAGEPWGTVAQTAIALEGGALEIGIIDAQDRYNINGLAAGGLGARETAREIVVALELPPETVARIAASLAIDGPLRRLEDLGPRAGVAPEELARLATLVVALPGRAPINLNAASPALVAILLQNSNAARILLARRDRQGFLGPQDVEASRLILPPAVGLRSDLFELRVTARIGATVQSMVSLLQRRRGPGGVPEVAVVDRRSATAAPVPPPPP